METYPRNTGIRTFENDGRSEMSMPSRASLSPLQIQPEPYVSSDEAAEFLKLNPRTVQRLAREGAIPAHPFGERSRKTWRFLLSELDAWMRAKVNSSRRPCRSVGR
jgi:excisionase family DNA binding protein